MAPQPMGQSPERFETTSARPRSSARALSGDSRPAGGVVDAGEQRMQSEPLREGAHELPAAFEFDGAAAERRGQAEVSHPHSGHRLRVAADGDVDAEPWVAQTQICLGKNKPEVPQLLGCPAEAE